MKELSNNLRSSIKWYILQLPDDRLQEVYDFIQFLLSKKQKGIKKNGDLSLYGIWKDMGFETINLEKEIKKNRKEIHSSLLHKYKI